MSHGARVIRTGASSGAPGSSSCPPPPAPEPGLLDGGYARSCSAMLKVAQMVRRGPARGAAAPRRDPASKLGPRGASRGRRHVPPSRLLRAGRPLLSPCRALRLQLRSGWAQLGPLASPACVVSSPLASPWPSLRGEGKKPGTSSRWGKFLPEPGD